MNAAPDTRAIVRALNAEAKRTNGQHPVSHVLVLDGIAYSVPRRQWGLPHAANGAPFGLPRVTADTVRRFYVGRGWTACTCSMCAGGAA